MAGGLAAGGQQVAGSLHRAYPRVAWCNRTCVDGGRNEFSAAVKAMAHFDNNELRSLTHSLVSAFIESHYPEERAYFPLIWQRFVEDGPPDISAGPDEVTGLLFPRLGLPFAEHRGMELAGALGIVVTWAILYQLNLKGMAPQLPEITRAIQCSSTELGAGETLANELACELGPQLFEMFQKLNEKGDRVYVERLEEGMERPESILCSRERAAAVGAEKQYDIVVDEVAHELRINPGDRRFEILKVPGMQRAMLWLVLTHVGDYISFREINSLRRHRAKSEATLPERSFYAYKNHLGRLLGVELRDKILGSARERQYPVRKTGFSFFWIRTLSDKMRSELLQGLGTIAGK